ncbi:MAG: hypothetical protein Solivirus1_75 [Solivirus sp.]|uniref:Uncharacterized protein n=1 Tax=Solivirus sp. TaxID=2487772 RepID=A0A3G5AFK7_9VIRU|nr:MAG: hypothetical protein Solivirus1_75 [Solivirus sp.]
MNEECQKRTIYCYFTSWESLFYFKADNLAYHVEIEDSIVEIEKLSTYRTNIQPIIIPGITIATFRALIYSSVSDTLKRGEDCFSTNFKARLNRLIESRSERN